MSPLLLRLTNLLFNDGSTKVRSSLPLKIGSFTLVKELSPSKPVQLYGLGIYTDSQGKQVFAKVWQGSKSSSAYHWLKNETAVYRHFSTISNERSLIKIPRFVDSVEEPLLLALFIEQIKGQLISQLPITTQVRIYVSSIEFLQSQKVNPSSRIGFAKLILGMPFLVIASLLNHPDSWPIILNGVVRFISVIPLLFKSKPRSFVHRDLTDNILITKRGSYLFDFGLSVQTYPLFEITNLLLGIWPNPPLSQAFLNSSITKKVLASSEQKRLFSALLIYTALIDMGLVKSTPITTLHSYLSYSLAI